MLKIPDYKALVESINDWVWEVDSRGVYTYVSPRIKNILGYEPEEIIGKTPFDLMPPEEAERIRKKFEEIVRTKSPIITIENVNKHKNGSLVVLETSGSPILDEKGNLIGYRGVDRDISKRLELIKKQKLLLSSLAFASNKLAVEKKDVHVQVDLMFSAFEHLFKETGVVFKPSDEPLNAVKQARDWMIRNYLIKEGQMEIEKNEEGEIQFHLNSACPLVEAGKSLSKESIKINCTIGLILLYFIKKVTGRFGFLIETKKFDEKGCTIKLTPVFGD